MSETLDDLLDILDAEDEDAPEFRRALEEAERIASAGSIEAAEAIAEIFAFCDTHRDPAKAYFWYHIALATQGYGTGFNNQQNSIAQYRGPDGDFRNEGQVNHLVGELGEFHVRQLDAEARKFLANRALSNST
jgi:hypothetical protein